MNEYASWYVELHTSEIGIEVSRKIAAHMVPRLTFGNVIIVTDMPESWMAPMRKRWSHVIKVLEHERAATRGRLAKEEFTGLINKLRGVTIMAGMPDERHAEAVWLVEPDELGRIPPGVMTVYVMSDLSMSKLLFWAKQIGDDGVIVLFRKQPLPANVG